MTTADAAAHVARDERFMSAALRIARINLGQTWPNPSVGALIIEESGDQPIIVGAGTTARGGRPHAEVAALEHAGERARGATCYVTLEPCAHTGQTPPCTDALVAAGVRRVVAALQDPDARTHGQGLRRLEAAGIETGQGVCGEEAGLVCAGHILRIAENRPFVTLKLAVTADGFIATADRKPVAITGEQTRSHVHMMRARHDAILVGAGTIVSDDPALTCRLPGMADRSPVRVVADRDFSVSENSHLIRTSQREEPATWVVGSGGSPADRVRALQQRGIKCILLDEAPVPHTVAQVLTALAGEGITRLFIEGGAGVAQAVLAGSLADEIVIAQSTRSLSDLADEQTEGLSVMGLGALASDGVAGTYEVVDRCECGDDTITTYRRAGLASVLLAHTRAE